MEEIDGIAAWRIGPAIDPTFVEYERNFWIAVSPYRVLRKTVRWAKTSVDIRSLYDTADPTSPLPKKVRNKRDEPGPQGSFDQMITVNRVEWPTAIPAERFTLKSMNLPKDTQIVDRRAGKVVGYWDGERLKPVSGEPK